MIEALTIATILALAGAGFMVVYRLTAAQQPMYPLMEMPWQSPYGPKDDYGRSFYPSAGYDEPEYQRDNYEFHSATMDVDSV